MKAIIGNMRGERRALCEQFGVSAGFLSQALNFKQNSMKARMVRHYALNNMHFYLIG